LARAPAGVAGLLPAYEAAWLRLWDRFRVNLHADRDTQLMLNLHVFHLLQTISPHTAELDAGSPPADCTARATAGTYSRTSCSSCR
jgi:trehalose/maltose hydrolase-like predicted phosphorylase